jgi:hypothetical protein
MIAVAAAVGLGSSAPFLVRILELNPWYSLPAAAISATAVTQLIGESAIKLYGDGIKLSEGEHSSELAVQLN